MLSTHRKLRNKYIVITIGLANVYSCKTVREKNQVVSKLKKLGYKNPLVYTR